MTTSLQTTNPEAGTFSILDITLRTFVYGDDELWFVGKDVCDALGITSRTAYRKLADDQRRTVSRVCLGLQPGKPLVLVNESGLYLLIMRSDKPAAKRFQDWVTGVVLPSIRRDGGYFMGEEHVPTGELSEDELVSRAMEAIRRKTGDTDSMCLGQDASVVALFHADAPFAS